MNPNKASNKILYVTGTYDRLLTDNGKTDKPSNIANIQKILSQPSTGSIIDELNKDCEGGRIEFLNESGKIEPLQHEFSQKDLEEKYGKDNLGRSVKNRIIKSIQKNIIDKARSYTQGDLYGYAFLHNLIQLNNKDSTLISLEKTKNGQNYEHTFMYINQQNEICGLAFVYNLKNTACWALNITQNVTSDDKDKHFHYFFSPDFTKT